jgi:hypothetical protein
LCCGVRRFGRNDDCVVAQRLTSKAVAGDE